ncbi:MAG TPA: hypothetical protein VNN73_04585 [Blastocatellia bacterium]|nr:hypothetical protein [Blastocatellia bacterium]
MRAIPVIIILTAIAVIGCNTNTNTNGNQNTSRTFSQPVPEAPKPKEALDPSFTSCNPYYPLKPGSRTKYTQVTSSGLVSDMTVVVDRGDNNTFIETSQTVDNRGGSELVRKEERTFACDGGRIILLAEKSEGRIQDMPSSIVNNLSPNAVFLLDPASLVKPGTTWSYSLTQTATSGGTTGSPSSPIVINFEVKGEEDITLQPFRNMKLKAVKVERKVGTNVSYDYFVKGLGFVKRESVEGTRIEMTETNLTPMQ